MRNQFQPQNPLEWKRFSSERKTLMLAEQHANAAEARLKEDVGAEERETQSRWLVDALITLGEFDEARKYLSVCPDLAELVDACEHAVIRPDDDDCGCEHEMQPTFEGGRRGAVVQTGAEPATRHIAERHAIWDKLNQRIVTLYQCCHCGDRNAYQGHPDEVFAARQDRMLQAQKNASA